jgi:hypothetical protein
MDTRTRVDTETKTPLKAKVKTCAAVFAALMALAALVCLPSVAFGAEAEDVSLSEASSLTPTVSDSTAEPQEAAAADPQEIAVESQEAAPQEAGLQEASASRIAPVNEIADSVTPLAYGSDIGAAWSLLNLICAVFGLFWSAALLIALFRKFHKNTAGEAYGNEIAEEEQPRSYHRNFHSYILAASLGFVSLTVFLFTENMTLPMVWVDAFSPIMVIFVIAQDLITLRLLKQEDLDEDPDAEISPHPTRLAGP